MTDANRRYDRRTVLRAGVTAGVVAVAGCSGDSDGTGDEPEATDGEATTTPPPSTAAATSSPTDTASQTPPPVGDTPGPSGPTPTVTADIESFYDDFEDSNLRNPNWRAIEPNLRVLNIRSPDGGAKVLRVNTARQRYAHAEWAETEPGWDQPWIVDGMFSPSSVPPLPENAGGTPQFSRPVPTAFGVGGAADAGVSAPRLDMQVYRPSTGETAVRLVDRAADIDEVVDAPPLDPERWYRYEITFDGNGRYTARRWPEMGARSDGVTVTATGATPARFARMEYVHDARQSGLGRLALDHAYLRYRRNPY